jgi:hypothetical protein
MAVGVAALAGCDRGPTVTGTLHDNFGAPVEGARLTVDGREGPTTGADGSFSFTHAPGWVPLVIEREGYARVEERVALRPEGISPLRLFTQRNPPETGLWLVTAEGYLPLRTCSHLVRAPDIDHRRYLIDRGIPGEIVPAEDGTVTFVDTATPSSGLAGRLTKVGDDRVFYRTERTLFTTDTVIVDAPETVEVTPPFHSEGRWFKASLASGTYVQFDRTRTQPYLNVIPDAEGRCHLFRVGPVSGPWLDDVITDEQLEAFDEQVKACWPEPPEGPGREQVVTVDLRLNEDGTVVDAALVRNSVLDSVRSGTAFMTAQSAALAAVKTCGPYRMFPPDAYQAWSDLTLTLRTADLFGP